MWEHNVARGSPPRRCVSGSGLAWPPLIDGVNVFMTDTARDDEVFGSHSILMHNGARGTPNGHPRAGGAAQASGFASNTLVPRAKRTAAHFFRALDCVQVVFRVDGGLVAD